ncbi:hypothetical protein [Candidatus Electrothrix sp.]
MKKSNVIALILLAISIALPTTFSMAAAEQDTSSSQAIDAKININGSSLK